MLTAWGAAGVVGPWSSPDQGHCPVRGHSAALIGFLLALAYQKPQGKSDGNGP